MLSPSTPTFRNAFPRAPMLLDERRKISPHHLGIGKTRKIVDIGHALVGFFSTGYLINWVMLDRSAENVIASGALPDAAVAWGGGQFCIDHVDEVVHLVYTTRSRLQVRHRTGRITAGGIEWERFERTAIAASSASLAAPWISVDGQGGVWVSAVGKDNNFLIAHAHARDGERFAFSQRPLFERNVEWHHSCVQVLPYGRRKAVAVGFSGTFPTETVLVAKDVDDELAIGPTTIIGPCDVNDQITFHFQALGDVERGRALVTYLGPKGRIDHATWDGAKWKVEEAIVPFPTIAPQNTLLADGKIGVLCADYEGQMFALSSSPAGWSKPRAVSRKGLVSISPAFARTGYGTGGIISAIRSADRRIPYLAGEIALDPEAPAKLFAGVAGGDEALTFAGVARVARDGGELVVRVPVAGGIEADLMRSGFAWSFSFQQRGAGPVELWALAASPRPTVLIFAPGRADARAVGTFALQRAPEGGVLELRVGTNLEPGADGVATACSYNTVETSDRGVPVGSLVDMVPFVQEPNSVVANEPRLLPQVFRRIV